MRTTVAFWRCEFIRERTQVPELKVLSLGRRTHRIPAADFLKLFRTSPLVPTAQFPGLSPRSIPELPRITHQGPAFMTCMPATRGLTTRHGLPTAMRFPLPER